MKIRTASFKSKCLPLTRFIQSKSKPNNVWKEKSRFFLYTDFSFDVYSALIGWDVYSILCPDRVGWNIFVGEFKLGQMCSSFMSGRKHDSLSFSLMIPQVLALSLKKSYFQRFTEGSPLNLENHTKMATV